jgi:hypothetical protein
MSPRTRTRGNPTAVQGSSPNSTRSCALIRSGAKVIVDSPFTEIKDVDVQPTTSRY